MLLRVGTTLKAARRGDEIPLRGPSGGEVGGWKGGDRGGGDVLLIVRSV